MFFLICPCHTCGSEVLGVRALRHIGLRSLHKALRRAPSPHPLLGMSGSALKANAYQDELKGRCPSAAVACGRHGKVLRPFLLSDLVLAWHHEGPKGFQSFGSTPSWIFFLHGWGAWCCLINSMDRLNHLFVLQIITFSPQVAVSALLPFH